tara:strand:+ start:1610 stop:1804 length:195 start_codon:yes stop_codon:yes gene_type:complete
MPMGIPLLLPFFLIYGIYLSSSSDGRLKLKNYYNSFRRSITLLKTKDGRKILIKELKSFWNGSN